MAHNITSTDNVVLHAQPAWHGLGVVVKDAPTPREALKIAGLDWSVQRRPLEFYDIEGNLHAVNSHVVNVRSDTHEQLGVVGADWRAVQNDELADLAENLNKDGIVRVESAGSLSAGRKVWFLLKGESVRVLGRDTDSVEPYILLANGHDGSLALTAQATTVRVVCNNTLRVALGTNNEKRIRYLHTKGVTANVDEIRQTLGLFTAARKNFGEQADALATRELSRNERDAFFLDVYTKTLGLEIPTRAEAQADPKGAGRKLDNAVERVAAWKRNFQVELDKRGTGHTAWAAFNSITEELATREDSPASSLFNGPATRRQEVFKAALALVR